MEMLVIKPKFEPAWLTETNDKLPSASKARIASEIEPHNEKQKLASRIEPHNENKSKQAYSSLNEKAQSSKPSATRRSSKLTQKSKKERDPRATTNKNTHQSTFKSSPNPRRWWQLPNSKNKQANQTNATRIKLVWLVFLLWFSFSRQLRNPMRSISSARLPNLRSTRSQNTIGHHTFTKQASSPSFSSR